MPLTNTAPSGTDSIAFSLRKINSLLFTGSGGVSAPASAANGTDSISLSLRKINSILYATGGSTGGGGGGIPEAPTDGQLYGRENAAWMIVPTNAVDPTKVAKSGDTMTGTLDVAKTTDFTDGVVVKNVFGDMLTVGPYSLVMAAVSTYQPSIQMSNNAGNAVHLQMNPSGDLVITAPSGVNAGKSVNLTSGKWV